MPKRSARPKGKGQPPLSHGEPKIRPSLQFSVVCETVQQVAERGAILVGLFDTINRVGDTPLPNQFVILDSWTSGMGIWAEHVTITDPEGELIVESSETRFWLQSSFHRHNVQHNITVPLTKPGLYTVHVHLDNEEVLSYKLNFVIHPQPAALS
jgi:hypothetical protein